MYNKGAYNIYYCMDMTNNIISLFVCFFLYLEKQKITACLKRDLCKSRLYANIDMHVEIALEHE